LTAIGPGAIVRADADVDGSIDGCAVTNARLRVAGAIGLLLGLAAIGLTLSQSPIAVARVNTTAQTYLATVTHTTSACQPNELLPRETTAIRLRTWAFFGPRVTVDVLAHGHVIARGERGSGWTGGVVTIPVSRLPTARSGVDLCFTLFLNGDESDELVGEPTTRALAARGPEGSLPGRVRVEYLRPSRSSWWSLAPEVARRMGLGHAGSGTWSVVLVVALMGSVAALSALAILREPG
jgi:hypothetical protein